MTIDEAWFKDFEGRMSARFAAIENRFDNLEDRMSARFAAIEDRFDNLEDRMSVRFERIERSLYGLVIDRMDTDEIERAAMSLQLDRHGRWISKLAKKTHTKLSTP